MLASTGPCATVGPVIYHSDALLRKHGLFVAQEGWGQKARYYFVDRDTYATSDPERSAAYEADSTDGQ